MRFLKRFSILTEFLLITRQHGVIYLCMDDTLVCPICGNKLRNVNQKSKYLLPVSKTANYIERTCSTGMNHSLQLFTDGYTQKVDLLKLSLNPKYSRYLEIDFINQKCRISCLKAGKAEYINIPKMIQPDFPKLVKLKERVSMYVTFS